MSVALRESFRFRPQLREARLDAPKGIARVVLITEGPGNSGDGHYYTRECLEKAVANNVFEATQCYYDHPTATEDKDIPERSVRSLAGFFANCELAEVQDATLGNVAAIVADFHPQKGAPVVLELLRTASEFRSVVGGPSGRGGRDYVGWSINASGVGQVAQIGDRTFRRVDEIQEVISVDLVTRAGAGGKLLTFRESDMSVRANRRAKTKTREQRGSRRGTALELFLESERDATTEAAAKEARAALKAAMKGQLKKGLESAGLTPEQDAALDKALGIEDGGPLDELLDKHLMGASSSNAEEDDVVDPAEADEDDDAEADKKLGVGGDDEPDDDDAEDVDDDAECNEDGDAGLPSEVKAAMKKREAAHRKALAERDAKIAKLLERAKAAEARAGENESRLLEAERSRIADALFAELKVPENHQGRLRRELREAKTAREMREHVKDYMAAFIATPSYGTTYREAVGAGAGRGRAPECLVD